MYKRVVSKVLLVMLVLILSACGSEKSTSTVEVTKMEEENYQTVAEQKLEEQEYKIITETYSKDNVTIEYPQIMNFKDEGKQQEINELIKKEALAPFLQTIELLEPDQQYEAEGYYEIKLKNKHMLSIAYNSYNNISPSIHPYYLFFTTNIDLATGNQLFLSDFVTKIDNEFITKLKNAKYVGDLGDEYKQQIKELVFDQYTSDEELIAALRNSKERDNGIHVYVTENTLGISMPVPHVAGDHVEFEMDFSLLKEK